jgi:hypothetical protein
VSVPHENPDNDTGLAVERLASPISPATVRIVAPRASERILGPDALRYAAHWVSEQLDPSSLGVDIALDSQRPRRLPASASLVALGALVPPGEELSAGEHWLFVAPVAASGLVPRRTEGSPLSAVAVRFQVGATAPSAAASAGIVWLRRPEGTYNGPGSEHVVFEAQAFAFDGTPLDGVCVIHFGGKLSGDVRFPAPFAVALASGDYDITASAPGVSQSSRSITVNSELGRTK